MESKASRRHEEAGDAEAMKETEAFMKGYTTCRSRKK